MKVLELRDEIERLYNLTNKGGTMFGMWTGIRNAWNKYKGIKTHDEIKKDQDDAHRRLRKSY